MAVQNTGDGRYTYDSMDSCPWCKKPVAIEYSGFNKMFKVTHRDFNPNCPLALGVQFATEGVSSYHNAIEMWNRRAE